jgi:pimeloyl-ACP methyl ester carboxylesterase
MIFLHGVAANRGSATGVIPRFTSKGFDVIAYDSRAHGESGGDTCTYGFREKEDLRRVIDALAPGLSRAESRGAVILLGTSLGGAVALQTAAIDPRITAVIAAEVFSDLATVARDRTPWPVPRFLLSDALRIAGERGNFDVEQVSPVRAAASVRVPVLLIHGANDRDTRPEHSKRILDALPGEKRLILVEGAGHNASLRGPEVWAEINEWIETHLNSGTSVFAAPWQ